MTEELLIHLDRISDKPIVFEGRVDIEEFPRLEEALATPEVDLRYKVTALLDRQRRMVVSCIIEGFVFLTCQSTLEAFRHGISIDERLVLVEHESSLPPIEEESDAEDYLVADGPVDVLDVVEDAILLALPMIPRKPGVAGEAVSLKDEQALDSPFAALAGLKKRT
ncbi:MAG TPA: YceD family protein [Usitatibacter sp.]